MSSMFLIGCHGNYELTNDDTFDPNSNLKQKSEISSK